MVCCTTCRTAGELGEFDHMVVPVCARAECKEKLRERQAPLPNWKQIGAGVAVVVTIMGLIARFAG